MREIRFRAWDFNKNKMTKSFTIEDYGIDQDEGGFHFELPYHFDGKESILMQSTGLKDASGKEVYEGDVVKLNNEVYAPYSQLLIIKFGEYSNNLNYEDHDSGYGWYFDEIHPSNHSEQGIRDIKDYKVVGNIYENGDLINGKQ